MLLSSSSSSSHAAEQPSSQQQQQQQPGGDGARHPGEGWPRGGGATGAAPPPPPVDSSTRRCVWIGIKLEESSASWNELRVRVGSIILVRPGTTEGGCLFRGWSDSPSVGRAQCLRFATETWCLGGVARCPKGESGAGLPQQLCGRTGTFRLPGVAETRHRSGVGRRPRAPVLFRDSACFATLRE